MLQDRCIPVHIYTPVGNGPFLLIVFFHGGGFVICNLESHDDLCRDLCGETGCVVISVDYRLAPEYRFPVIRRKLLDLFKGDPPEDNCGYFRSAWHYEKL